MESCHLLFPHHLKKKRQIRRDQIFKTLLSSWQMFDETLTLVSTFYLQNMFLCSRGGAAKEPVSETHRQIFLHVFQHAVILLHFMDLLQQDLLNLFEPLSSVQRKLYLTSKENCKKMPLVSDSRKTEYYIFGTYKNKSTFFSARVNVMQLAIKYCFVAIF